MNDWYTNKRTQTVLSVLIRIERLVSCLVSAALAKLTSQSSGALIVEARKIVTFDQELGQKGAGMSRWPLPDPDSDLTTFLRDMNQIVIGLEVFRGSSQGLTDTGKQLVDTHFSLLAQAKQAVDFALVNPQDSSGISSRLENVSAALQAQIAEAEPLSLDGQSDPWVFASPSPSRKTWLLVLALIIALIAGITCWLILR